MLVIVRISLATLPALVLSIVLTGCTHSAPPSPAEARAIAAEQRQENDASRAEIEQIPPPSKTQYLSVKSLSAWQNPYLTVQGGMVTLHVMLADANPSTMGLGGMLRPVGARRQDLNVRLSDLGPALRAIPESSWPYGRVVAVEEAHNIPVAARPEIRRNVEMVIRTLTELGVVAYEWDESGKS
jgi:hypothetical protein